MRRLILQALIFTAVSTLLWGCAGVIVSLDRGVGCITSRTVKVDPVTGAKTATTKRDCQLPQTVEEVEPDMI